MATPAASVLLHFTKFNGPKFDEAIYARGPRSDGSIGEPWLQAPQLKYYAARSVLLRSPDQRELFVCYRALPKLAYPGAPTHQIVGLLELDRSPQLPREAWLMYVSVAPVYQRQGIGTSLLTLMAEHLKASKLSLSRSRASDEGAARIQKPLDALLARHGIPWRQGERSSG